MIADPSIRGSQPPKLATRPYPVQYQSSWSARDGTSFTFRPIRPEDEALLIAFHATLSEETLRLRYFSSPALDLRTSHERLIRTCCNDYDRELALVIEHVDPNSKIRQVLGVGRLSKLPGTSEAEFAILVSDSVQ